MIVKSDMSHLSDAAPYFGGAIIAHMASKALLPQTMTDAYSLLGCFFAWPMAFDNPIQKESEHLLRQVNGHIAGELVKVCMGLGCKCLSLGFGCNWFVQDAALGCAWFQGN